MSRGQGAGWHSGRGHCPVLSAKMGTSLTLQPTVCIIELSFPALTAPQGGAGNWFGQRLASFLVNGQTVNILGSGSHPVSAATRLCHCCLLVVPSLFFSNHFYFSEGGASRSSEAGVGRACLGRGVSELARKAQLCCFLAARARTSRLTSLSPFPPCE